MWHTPGTYVGYTWVVGVVDLLCIAIALYARSAWAADRLSTNMWTAMAAFYGGLVTTVLCILGLMSHANRSGGGLTWYFLAFHPLAVGLVWAFLPMTIR